MEKFKIFKIVIDFLIQESKNIHRYKCITDRNYRDYSTQRFYEFNQKHGRLIETYAELYKLRDIIYRVLTLMWNQNDITEIVASLLMKSEKYGNLILFQAADQKEQLLTKVVILAEFAKVRSVAIVENVSEVAVARSYDFLANDRLWKGSSDLDSKVGQSYPLKGGCKDSSYLIYPVELVDNLGMIDYLYRVSISHFDNELLDESFVYSIKSNSCRTRYLLNYGDEYEKLKHRGIKSLKVYGYYENHTNISKSILFRFGKDSPFIRQKYLVFDYEFIVEAYTKGFFFFNESVYARFEEYIFSGKFGFDPSIVDIELLITPGLEYSFQIDSFIDMQKIDVMLDNKLNQSKLLLFWLSSEIAKPVGYTTCNVEECDHVYEGFGYTLGFLEVYEKTSGLFDVDVCCVKCFNLRRAKLVINENNDFSLIKKERLWPLSSCEPVFHIEVQCGRISEPKLMYGLDFEKITSKSNLELEFSERDECNVFPFINNDVD